VILVSLFSNSELLSLSRPRLYRDARLVHGDLSEFNIMVVPASLVENRADGVEGNLDELQAVLIDFGQAVDIRHPEASELLERDVERVQAFFKKVGVEVIGMQECIDFVKGSEQSSVDSAGGVERNS
jgi:serine/threonine-protein kinase RIO1